MEVLALIPARGRSKSIPKKNIVQMGAHPLIAYSIASALASAKVTRTIVSTDDSEIAEISRSYGAELPFVRPAEFARDDTGDLPVFLHTLKWLNENENYRPDIIVQLRPTTPFRPKGLIDQAIDVYLNNKEADCVRGMVKSGENPFKMWKKGDDGSMVPLLNNEYEEPYNMPRQHLPTTYWQTGHIDVIPLETITKMNSLTGRKIFPIFIERAYCVDIDVSEDLEFAKWRFNSGKLKINVPERQ